MKSQTKYRFILLISGMSSKSIRAIENIKKICDKYIPGNYDLEIIDIREQREKALRYQIVAVPTLLKADPRPSRIILGDLSNTNKILKTLDLTEL